MQGAAAAAPDARMEIVQGFNIYRWRASGLNVVAISDLNAEELHEFCEKFEANMSTGSVG